MWAFCFWLKFPAVKFHNPMHSRLWIEFVLVSLFINIASFKNIWYIKITIPLIESDILNEDFLLHKKKFILTISWSLLIENPNVKNALYLLMWHLKYLGKINIERRFTPNWESDRIFSGSTSHHMVCYSDESKSFDWPNKCFVMLFVENQKQWI